MVHPGGIKPPTSFATSRTGVGITDNARRSQSIERFDNEFAKTTAQRHAAKTHHRSASRRTQPRILIGGDARFLDLLQRFRPGTYFKVLARRIRGAAGEAGEGAAGEVSFVCAARPALSNVVPASCAIAHGSRDHNHRVELLEEAGATAFAKRFTGIMGPGSALATLACPGRQLRLPREIPGLRQ